MAEQGGWVLTGVMAVDAICTSREIIITNGEPDQPALAEIHHRHDALPHDHPELNTLRNSAAQSAIVTSGRQLTVND